APIPEATRISLDLKNVTIPEAAAEFAKQAKVSFGGVGDQTQGGGGILAALTAKRINLAIKDQPFWSAMREFARQAEVFPISEWNQRSRITLQNGKLSTVNSPVVVNGACAI